MGEPSVEHSRKRELDFPVVGIGASAGGLAALRGFLENLPPRPGMSFVVVMHLSPTHKSHASEILQRSTSLTVAQVNESLPIEVDHVYVIPPAKDLRMDDGMLCLVDQSRVNGRQGGIDVFFRTLADAHSTRAFGIVLSGTGADGALGLRTLKERGGVSMAQEPDQAEHDGMPRAAIAAGVVDFVLRVEDMPGRLSALWANAARIRLPDLRPDHADEPHPESPTAPTPVDGSEAALRDVLATLHTRTRHDFRLYKRGTVLRRIERRMQVNAIPDIVSYRDFLREHATETTPLLRDMLISVTSFFRDPEAFDALQEEVVDRILEHRDDAEPIRVWVPGCATGEEAYSIAILLRERCDALSRKNEIQVFATDIDERAIAMARVGSYPLTIAPDLTPARLRRFFRRDGDQYRVAKVIRDTVLFASHNVLRDPPFSRLDLICCRNLLIYLNHEGQSAVLDAFRFALRADGFLFVGSSESGDALDNAFVPVNKKHRFYQLDPNGARRQAPRPVPATTALRPLGMDGMPRERRARSFAEIHQLALERHSVPSVLVDGRNHILHLSPGVARFLRHGSGRPSHDLISNAVPALQLELRAALFRRAQTKAEVVVRDIRMEDADGSVVDLFVHPFHDAEGSSGDLSLVMFAERTRDRSGGPGNGASDQTVAQGLQAELDELRSQFQETFEHSNASTEELKASNEELQAMNEEMRSATEELETSKEELQSINEELTTVNDELKGKVAETAQVNDDLQNLISSTDIAVVFVDEAMRVKRFTPSATSLFKLIATDIGRPLSDVKHQFEGPDPVDEAEKTFRTLKPQESEIHGIDGRVYLSRILPYRTVGDRIEGAVLTYVDITTRREAEAEAYRVTQRLRQAAESTRDFAIISMDDGGIIRAWNLGAQRTFGYAEDEVIGRHFELLFSEEDRLAGVPAKELEGARLTGRGDDERWHVRKDGALIYCSGVVSLVEDGAGFGFSKIARDVTGGKTIEARREAQLAREMTTRREAELSNRLKDEFLAVMSHELKHPLNLIHINAELLSSSPEVRELPIVRRAAETIRQTVANQAKIIDDLLDLSRMRTGKMTLRLTPLRLDEVVRAIVEGATEEAKGRGIALSLDLAAAGQAVVAGDRVRVEQIIWNLLSNALKFTPRGGTVTLSLRSRGEGSELEVADSGRGIAKEFLSSIFGMFQQEKRTYSQGEGGLGIGLALVKELTEAQGGWVAARSDGVGHGTVFTVWLPRSEEAVGPARQNGDDAPNPLRDLRVLLVDDAPDVLEVTAELLELEGAIVTASDSGKAALASLEGADFDLLISDVGMPGMDGYELIRQVRVLPRTAGIRAIALTGFGRSGDEQQAMKAGFDAHLAKPTSMEDLKATLSGLDRHS